MGLELEADARLLTVRRISSSILEHGPAFRRIVLLALVAGVPAFFLRIGIDPINVPKLSLLLVGTSLVAAVRVAELLQGASDLRFKPLWLPAVAIALPLSLAWIASPYKEWALLGKYGRFQGLIPYLVIIVFGLFLVDAFFGRPYELALGFVVGGGVVGGYALVQVLRLDPFVWSYGVGVSNAATSTLGNPNFTGGFLAMTLPIALVMFHQDRGRRKTWRLLFILLVIAWIVTFSQGGWIAGTAGTAVTAGFLFDRRYRHSRRVGALIAAVVAVGLAGSVALGVLAQATQVSLPPFVANEVEARGLAWERAVRMGLEHPLVGRGPNTFAAESVLYRTPEDAITYPLDFADDPHSVLLSFFANAGLLGALGFVALVAWVLRQGWLVGQGDVLSAGFLGALTAYFVQSLVSIDELSLRLALWVALAGLVVASAHHRSQRSVKQKKKAAPRGTKRRSEPARLRFPLLVASLVLPISATAWWSAQVIVADARVRHANLLAATGKYKDAQEQFEQALDFRDEYEYRRRYGNAMKEAVQNLRPGGEPFFVQGKKAFAYLDHFPDVPSMLVYAQLLRLWETVDPQTREEAIRVYENAHRLDPFNPSVAVSGALAALEAGRAELAAAFLRPALPYVGARHPEYWAAVALAHARLGRRPEAEEALQKALLLDEREELAQQARRELQRQASR